MLAVVKEQPGEGHVVLKDVPEPVCGPDQIKIEVVAAGICSTDIHISHGRFSCNPPVVLGHEFSGKIVEVGERTKNFTKDERVTALPSAAVTCGKCDYCRSGDYCFCPERKGMGHGVDGAFCKYVTVKSENVYRLNDNIGYEAASLCEPLACALHPLTELCSPKPGAWILVSGPGIIGLLTTQVAITMGLRVILVGTSQDKARLVMGSSFGAATICLDDDDLDKRVKELTGGKECELVIESAGAAQSFNNCLRAVKPMGTIVLIGIYGQSINNNIDGIVKKQIRIQGSYGHTRKTWASLMAMLESNKIELDPLISEILPLTQWEQGFEYTESRRGLKVILKP